MKFSQLAVDTWRRSSPTDASQTKPSYVADWADQAGWQRETNSDIFEAIEKHV